MKSAESSRREFLAERDHLSHNLIRNVFFAGLQPCWDGTGRYSEQDIIFRALTGDQTVADDAREVVRLWKEEIYPVLLALIAAVESRFGFVTTERWVVDSESAKRAGALIADMTFFSGLSTAKARATAKRFWNASDAIHLFVATMKSHFADYFETWDRSLIRE